MIAERDISIVVQGPILAEAQYGITNEMTKMNCQRIKRLFPQSELILSTWEGQNVQGIPYDVLLLNKDPGGMRFNYYDPRVLNNCNRLIVSTSAGIQQATGKYVLKVRSDLYLVSKKFLNYFDTYPLYNEEYKFVTSRILAFSMWSIRGHKTRLFTMPKPFHISDWAYFGYKNDLVALYDVPLIETEFSEWFLTRCKPFHDIAPEILWKMPPEQHITSSFLKKHTPVNLQHTADESDNNQTRSAQLLMNNFLVLDQTQFFLISLKHFCFQFSRENHEWFIYHSGWLKDYCHFISTHSWAKKFWYTIQIGWRSCMMFIVGNILRLINKKRKFASRFIAGIIKRNER